ncbi:MAG: efflux RND transporter periplasmic adaptor subunit [Tannerellaceae bacterium]
MNKKQTNKLIWGTTLLVVVGASVFFISGKDGKAPLKLETVHVAKDDIVTSVTATGTIEPIKLVEVGTQVSGVISNIYVDYNSVVKKGEVLAEIDKKMLASEVETARANLQSRQVELENQQKNYNRQKTLWEKQAISKADWEAAETTYKTAQLAVTSQKAAVLKAETNLGYATIYSTIDGVVISRDVEEGQTVASSFNTPTLFTIANDLTKMRVIANVDEADIGEVREGQRATFTVDAYPDDEFQGTVVQVRLQATTESNVVTYKVVVDAPNPDLKLKPGLTASINIFTMEKRGLRTIPAKALRFVPNPELNSQLNGVVFEPGNLRPDDAKTKKIVWRKKDNVITPLEITTGATNGIVVEVTGGLNDNDEIVTGVTQNIAGASAQGRGNGEVSPFMPQPPGGNKKK